MLEVLSDHVSLAQRMAKGSRSDRNAGYPAGEPVTWRCCEDVLSFKMCFTLVTTTVRLYAR
jgi:hypothetical protein